MTDIAQRPQVAAVEPAYVNVYSVEKGAGVPEQVFVTFWMFIIYLPLEVFSPLRYLCILGFLALMAYDYRRLMPLMFRSWPLFIVALFGLMSVGWSPFPGEALRSGILFVLTSFVAVVIAGRLTTQQALRVVMFAGMITTIVSIPMMPLFSLGGWYASKNYFAAHMLFCMLLSLITVLNEKEHAWLRLLALPFVPVCFYFNLLANSTTALVFAILGGAALIGVKLFWSPVTRIRGLPVFVILAAFAALVTLMLVVVNMPDNEIVAKFLGLVGKDATLTGRTSLWEGARLAAEERPWFGTGLEGFWFYDSGAAQTLNENDYKAYGTKLTFHSAYWEVRVHLGFIGLALFIYYLGWTSLRSLGLWFRDGSLVNSALLILVIVNLTITFTESTLWSTFTTPAYLQALAGIAAFRLFDPKFEGVGKIVGRK
ncbi:hypothetical protein K1X12_13660 [Hyphomonas sp. WL0036]|uniref:O-antigen ligase family protein n=1 Tax=Hyphomonas sediminis TaxID=2866160 RepID=UPI001C813C4F|nr:O-antigen ligase family protein [Hyphomonas sediminis]MBY9067952.1 hypothetical protein [Hyphomonas sediminis]